LLKTLENTGFGWVLWGSIHGGLGWVVNRVFVEEILEDMCSMAVVRIGRFWDWRKPENQP